VKVDPPPSNPTQACSLSGEAGTLSGSHVTDIVVSCSTSNFNITGSVGNLVGSGLELSNNSTDRVAIEPTGGAAPFKFPTAVPSASTYNVKVEKNPTSPVQRCEVDPLTASGTVLGTDVDVKVNCVTEGFIISGQVTGLRGSGLVLQLNRTESLPIASNGRFYFATPLLPTTQYEVIVLSQPSNPNPFHYCLASGATSGFVGNEDVEDIVISCTSL
jgi:hypothetical protein